MIFKKRTIKNIPKIFLSIVIILILDSGISFAQLFPNLGGQRSGTTSLQFLKIGTSARATGMAESYVAVSDDITSLYWNPAGLVSFKENGITASYTQWFVDTKLMNFGAVYHLDANNALGINVTSLSTEDMKVTTEYQPNGTGAYFRFSDLSFGLSYARQMTEQFSFGATIKYVNENLGELQMEGVLGDLATFYRTGLGTSRFAIMISNFGGQISPVGQVALVNGSTATSFQKFPPPTNFQLGFAMEPWMNKENRLTTSIQLNSPTDNAENLAFGVEYAYKNFLFFRGGFKVNVDDENFSGGLGFNVPISFAYAQFDYSLSNYTQLGLAQRLTVNVLFPNK
ncbi:MAG: PorV/PorQ family protein [Ignavibacteriae bacterium]|nr:PorV/PorQ family protein [Ignavibacteriota bacterium]